MAMTKKHFEMIARQFQQALVDLDIAELYPFNDSLANATFNVSARKMARDQLQNVAAAIANDFAYDNPRFDRARFMAACGF